VPTCKLLDARSSDEDFQLALGDIAAAEILGLDCETTDEETAHPGIRAYRNKKRWVFDNRRTTMTGFSFYADGSDTAWYVNLAHADIENRLPRRKADVLLSQIRDDALVIAHNASFELVMFENCLGVILKNVLCSLQLAVSHHGPDEYDVAGMFFDQPLTHLAKHRKRSSARSPTTIPRRAAEADERTVRAAVACSPRKTVDAAHSYNGFVKEIAFGYNLKKLVQSPSGSR
jgi:hypothetical protein